MREALDSLTTTVMRLVHARAALRLALSHLDNAVLSSASALELGPRFSEGTIEARALLDKLNDTISALSDTAIQPLHPNTPKGGN